MKNIYLKMLAVFFLMQACVLWSEDEINSCAICHPNKQEKFSGSVHASAGYSCHTCHGGDPLEVDPELAMSKDTGFIGKPDKKQIALICGECHAKVEVMNPFGIPTDQLAQYRTSVHGKQVLEEDDNNPAVCSDCHGSHNILKVKDPASRVYPYNLPVTCAKCHGDQKLMEKYGISSDIFEEYITSVHGVALYEKEDLGAANCASCHGGHGAVPPGVSEVGFMCGKCHINEKKYFLESPHAKYVQEGIFPECDSCHGHHDVAPATLELYQTACAKCHKADGDELKLGESIYEALQKYHVSFNEIEKIVKQASIEGMFVEEEEASLEEIKTQVVRSAPEQHSLSKDKILKHQETIMGASEVIASKIDQKRKFLKWRKLALIPIWIFILFMIIVLRKALQRIELKKKIKKDIDLSRRDFLSWIIKGGFFTLFMGFLVPAISFIWPEIRRGPVSNKVLVGAVDEIPVWGVKKIVVSGSAVLVIRTPKGFNALSAICTHLGCIVDWNGRKKLIECPCHAGVFDPQGKVLSGPPPRPLPSYKVEIFKGNVYVKV